MKTEIQKGADFILNFYRPFRKAKGSDFTKHIDDIMLLIGVLYSKSIIDSKDIKRILKEL